VINWMDERPIGYGLGTQPFVSYGLNLGFNWKNWSLMADFAGATMQSFRRNWELKFPFQNDGSAPHYMLEDRWHREDPYDPSSPWVPGTYPAIRKSLRADHPIYYTNDFWVTNVHYFRLKNIELGYSLPKNIASKAGASDIRVYINGTNLFSFDNVRKFEIDPEIASENGLVYPLQKVYLLGFNLTF